MPLLLGLLSCAIASALGITASHLWGFDPYSLSIWFIVPVGGLLGGALAGSGWYLGLYLGHERARGSDYAFASALAVAAFIGTYAGVYLIDPSRGDAGFWEHLVRTMASRGITLFTDSGSASLPSPRPGTTGAGALTAFHWFKFGLEGLGFLLGSLSGGLLAFEEAYPCPLCKDSYTRRALLFFFPAEELDRAQQELKDEAKDGPRFLAWIGRRRGAVPTPAGPHYRAEICLCEKAECPGGQLWLRWLGATQEGELAEHPDYRKVLPLRAELVLAYRRNEAAGKSDPA